MLKILVQYLWYNLNLWKVHKLPSIRTTGPVSTCGNTFVIHNTLHQSIFQNRNGLYRVRFRGDGDFGRKWCHYFSDTAHALDSLPGVVVPSGTSRWVVWRCRENIRIKLLLSFSPVFEHLSADSFQKYYSYCISYCICDIWSSICFLFVA